MRCAARPCRRSPAVWSVTPGPTARARVPVWRRWFLSAYDGYPSYIQRCDAARYFIVYRHGGVYADLDYECTKPFAPVLGRSRAVFSHKQGTNYSRGLVNAIFASEASHPLWRKVFDLMLERANASAASGGVSESGKGRRPLPEDSASTRLAGPPEGSGRSCAPRSAA